ncbi:MAG: response regulator [Coleofasciculus sp.]
MTLILIVDDAAFTRRMIRKTLVADGHGTLEATNGQEGLDMAIAHQPDYILTDMLMPVMDGFQLLTASIAKLIPPSLLSPQTFRKMCASVVAS